MSRMYPLCNGMSEDASVPVSAPSSPTSRPTWGSGSQIGGFVRMVEPVRQWSPAEDISVVPLTSPVCPAPCRREERGRGTRNSAACMLMSLARSLAVPRDLPWRVSAQIVIAIYCALLWVSVRAAIGADLLSQAQSTGRDYVRCL
jgi:hypothetical protein